MICAKQGLKTEKYLPLTKLVLHVTNYKLMTK